jgi:hypothetical protein
VSQPVQQQYFAHHVPSMRHKMEVKVLMYQIAALLRTQSQDTIHGYLYRDDTHENESFQLDACRTNMIMIMFYFNLKDEGRSYVGFIPKGDWPEQVYTEVVAQTQRTRSMWLKDPYPYVSPYSISGNFNNLVLVLVTGIGITPALAAMNHVSLQSF